MHSLKCVPYIAVTAPSCMNECRCNSLLFIQVMNIVYCCVIIKKEKLQIYQVKNLSSTDSCGPYKMTWWAAFDPRAMSWTRALIAFPNTCPAF